MYRHQVAEHVAAFADQVVLLVTETQWRGEVEQSLADKTARSYVLTYFTPRTDVEPVDIVLAGKAFPLVQRSPNDFEYSEVREV